MQTYLVPYAYEMYGRMAVEANSREEAIEIAKEKLEKMTASEMEVNAEYLADSQEIDEEGLVLDEDGNVVEEE